MKRDMDLVRRILLAIEKAEPSDSPASIEHGGKLQPLDAVIYHVGLLVQGGLLVSIRPEISDVPIGNLSCADAVAVHVKLTWSGHDFLDVARDDDVWSWAMREIKDNSLASVPFGVLEVLLARRMCEKLAL